MKFFFFFLLFLGATAVHADIQITSSAYQKGELPKEMTFCQTFSPCNANLACPLRKICLSGTDSCQITFPAYKITELPQNTQAIAWVLYDESAPFTHMFGVQRVDKDLNSLYLSQNHTYPITHGYTLSDTFQKIDDHQQGLFVLIQAPPANPFKDPHRYTLVVSAFGKDILESPNFQTLKQCIHQNKGILPHSRIEKEHPKCPSGVFLVSANTFGKNSLYAQEDTLLGQGSITGTF